MTPSCTVFVGDGDWRFACVDEGGAHLRPVDQPADAPPADKARAVAELVAEHRAGPSVVVALASSDCLSASIRTDDLGRGGRRQAMGFRLEEHLPVSAEDAVADYVERQGVALGVCAELDRLTPIVRALEAAGLSVRHICPAAMLAAARLLGQQPGVDGLLIVGDTPGAGIDFIEIEHKAARRWWWLTDAPAMRERLEAWRQQTPDDTPTLAVIGDAPELPDAIPAQRAQDAGPTESAAVQAAGVLAGELTPWIDLRRDALAAPNRHQAYRGHAAALASAAALLLLCVIGATYWRAMAYQAQTDRLYTEQAQVFKGVFPNRRASGSLLTQLERERDTLAGLGGRPSVAPGENASDLYPPSALSQLHAVLSALPNQPAKPRYQVSDLVIEPDLVRIDGKAESHQAASQVAASLRAKGAYEVEQPNSRAIGEGVFGYSFFARPKPALAGGGTR